MIKFLKLLLSFFIPHRDENFFLENMFKMLRLEEGLVLTTYRDSEGYLTVGIGHLMDPAKGGSLKKEYKAELQRNGKLSEESAYKLFEEDLYEIMSGVDRAIPWIKELNEPRQAVLYSMAFQMGVAGLLKFKNTLAMIKEGNYEGASKGMLNSLWAKQTPHRNKRHSLQMFTGEWDIIYGITEE